MMLVWRKGSGIPVAIYFRERFDVGCDSGIYGEDLVAARVRLEMVCLKSGEFL